MPMINLSQPETDLLRRLLSEHVMDTISDTTADLATDLMDKINGLPRKSRRIPRSHAVRDKAIALAAEGLSYKAIGKRLGGVHPGTIGKWMWWARQQNADVRKRHTTLEQRAEMVRRRANGERADAIAASMGVTTRVVWGHLRAARAATATAALREQRVA